MKLLLILFLTAFISLQKTQAPVKVLEATHQHWSNIEGKPKDSGETYAIKVFINTPQPVEVTNLWIGHKNVPFRIKFSNQEIMKRIANGDSLYIVYTKTDGAPEGDFTHKRLPMEYKGAAFIEYTLAGKAQYLVVKNFKQLPELKGL